MLLDKFPVSQGHPTILFIFNISLTMHFLLLERIKDPCIPNMLVVGREES